MRKLIFLSAIFVALFFLSACVQKSAGLNGNNTAEGRREFGRADFGQPERRPDINGIVKSVSGNQVTLIKIERPERPANGTETGGNERNNSRTAPSFSANSGRPMGGPGMGMRGGDGQGDAASREAMLERLKAMGSGEVTVSIPIGIKMLKSESAEAEKMEMSEATLSDIVKDKMIAIWVQETATSSPELSASTTPANAVKNIAEFVMINR